MAHATRPRAGVDLACVARLRGARVGPRDDAQVKEFGVFYANLGPTIIDSLSTLKIMRLDFGGRIS